LVAFILVISITVPATAGKNGRGRNHSSKKPTAKAHTKSRQHKAERSFSEHQPAKGQSHLGTKPAKRSDTGDRGPWPTQRQNEERKLEHRLDTADHLDQLAERNGNPRLHDTAERMRQKAYQHHEKRIAKIDSKDPLTPAELTQSTGDIEGLSTAPPTAAPADTWAKELTESRQELLRRLDASQELFQLADQGGSEELRNAASRIEQQALQQFHDRLDSIYPSQVQPLGDLEAKSVLLRPISGR
jgi:hypothetical protein